MRIIKGLVFLENCLAYRGKWLWHQSYSTLGSETWHWFLLYNIIKIMSKIKGLAKNITHYFRSKPNIVWLLIALTVLSLVLASKVFAESRFEVVVKACNNALLEKNWEVWAACNAMSTDGVQIAMVELREQIQDMVASEFQGKLGNFQYEPYKTLGVLSDTEGLVIHSIIITFTKNNNLFSLTLQALLRAEVEQESLVLRLQILRMSMGEPILIGSKL